MAPNRSVLVPTKRKARSWPSRVSGLDSSPHPGLLGGWFDLRRSPDPGGKDAPQQPRAVIGVSVRLHVRVLSLPITRTRRPARKYSAAKVSDGAKTTTWCQSTASFRVLMRPSSGGWCDAQDGLGGLLLPSPSLRSVGPPQPPMRKTMFHCTSPAPVLRGRYYAVVSRQALAVRAQRAAPQQ